MIVDVDESICCNEIRKCDVVDSTGRKIGKIGDMTFTFDGNLNLAKFVLRGSAWDEFLESIGARPEKDPVFDASLIHRIGDKVQLNTNVNSLKTTLDEGAITEAEIRWSELKDRYIVDKDEVRVGKAVDIDFDIDGTASLTVGGGVIEETLESIGLKTDVDIIVPAETIESMGDKIKLRVSKDELQLTMDNALEDAEIRNIEEKTKAHREVEKIRLFFLKE
jgi:sporulation protein YlmC with PRC-barrel domain